MFLHYDDIFKGLHSKMIIFQVANSLDKNVFNGWYFDNAESYSDFWFHKDNNVIYRTVDHIVGKESI